MNHVNHRDKVLKEFNRVLKPGGQLLYTDPNRRNRHSHHEELAIRSPIGFFLFVPLGENERLLSEAGFTNMQVKDVKHTIAAGSSSWHKARENHKANLLQIESADVFNGLQAFLKAVHKLTSERRLSRLRFTAVKYSR